MTDRITTITGSLAFLCLGLAPALHHPSWRYWITLIGVVSGCGCAWCTNRWKMPVNEATIRRLLREQTQSLTGLERSPDLTHSHRLILLATLAASAAAAIASTANFLL